MSSGTWAGGQTNPHGNLQVPPPFAVPIADKVRFLSLPSSYWHNPAHVDVRETHMSWLFFTGTLVFKLKKPAIYPYVDFSTLEARHQNSLAEVGLNQRLAGEVYRRAIALRRLPSGQLTLGGEGEIVDWLVEMLQLAERDMLDHRIRMGQVSPDDARLMGETLARFYRAAVPQIADGPLYLAHLEGESRINRQILGREDLGLAPSETGRLLDHVDKLLARARPEIKSRIAGGCIVEGHGDLRPEHVCLQRPLIVIDCLEFDRRMRILDPYDEVHYLGLECALLGAPWVGPLLVTALDRRLGRTIGKPLLHTYGAFRAVLMARLALAHLLDPAPRDPHYWRARARTYLRLAAGECVRARE